MPDQAGLAVVDASVVLKWQFDDEEDVAQAVALRDDFYLHGTISLIAPQLLMYEVANGVAVALKRKRIARDKAIEAMSNLVALGVELRVVEPLPILELALQYDLAAYDSAYLALACAENCDLWTGDKTFYQTLKGKSLLVKWIGDYPGESSH